MVKTFFTANVSQTKRLGSKLARDLLKGGLRKKSATVIALQGELGAGKTTFLQGFAKGLGTKKKVLSPTFIIARRLKIKDLGFKNFYHIDCYRLKKPKELLDLGFKKLIAGYGNIVAVEWADKVKKVIPRRAIWLNFSHFGRNNRKINVNIPRGI